MLVGFWFGVIAVLWAGFFVLEGFDFGVGMLAPFMGRTEDDHEVALRSIGPVWDGNEVWLLVAGGATFAAFPEWYASVFSGFYLAFALLLLGLILRGIGIEYRSKVATARGRRWCEGAVAVGSFLPALLLGVAFADFLRGVKLDGAHVVTGSFWDLLPPFALLGGLVTLSLFLLHGALFLSFRTVGPTAESARRLTRPLAAVTIVLGAVFLAWSVAIRGKVLSDLIALVIVLALLLAARFVVQHRYGAAFAGTSVVTALVPVWAFAALWPYVLPATNGSQFSLTMHQASSSNYTLTVMTVVAVVVTPIVLAYQAWSYWVFRARVGLPSHGSGSPTSPVEKARHAAESMVERDAAHERKIPEGSA